MNDNSEQGTVPSATDFDEWLEVMDPKLAGFGALLADDFPNDFSRASLAWLEDVLLQAFPDIAAVHRDEAGDFVDRCVRYIGETLIRGFGGSWEYGTESKDLFAGVPYVRVDDGVGIPIAPFYEITALVDRRTKTELTSLYDTLDERCRERRSAEAQDAPAARETPRVSASGPDAPLREWLADMDGKLTAWRDEHLARDFPFDFSRDSLAVLEQEVLTRFAGRDEVELPANLGFTEGAVRYFGETIVRGGFAEWRWNKEEANGGDATPPLMSLFLVAKTEEAPEESVPLRAIRLAALKRTGDKLVKVYDRMRDSR
ncbi:hypothetical protein GCM10009678_50930 [Actinomadura kijaniata]|uniref:Uncharacterized protein n=1 Tax=Actinomadura namibiensis TaxID=182080 RepID=A0A7W3QIR5_ACTNM|nr:hypothetical protein [Actinomadura namibiensis]MBA8948537.1 hypothetical protein [Actinomadura namibiensis]